MVESHARLNDHPREVGFHLLPGQQGVNSAMVVPHARLNQHSLHCREMNRRQQRLQPLLRGAPNLFPGRLWVKEFTSNRARQEMERQTGEHTGGLAQEQIQPSNADQQRTHNNLAESVPQRGQQYALPQGMGLIIPTIILVLSPAQITARHPNGTYISFPNLPLELSMAVLRQLINGEIPQLGNDICVTCRRRNEYCSPSSGTQPWVTSRYDHERGEPCLLIDHLRRPNVTILPLPAQFLPSGPDVDLNGADQRFWLRSHSNIGSLTQSITTAP